MAKKNEVKKEKKVVIKTDTIISEVINIDGGKEDIKG